MRENLSLVDAVDRALSLASESDERIAFEAGVAHRYRDVKDDAVFSADYQRIGVVALQNCLSMLRGFLCAEGEPKPWLTEFLSGNNQREAAVAILAAICSRLEVSLSIAVPIAAMLLKRGIPAFCRSE